MNPTLTDILWSLAIGVLFIVLMRKGGCCGGHQRREITPENNAGKIEHKQ